MLATRGHQVPTGSEWLHEVKWDGIRLLIDLRADGSMRLTSRNENDVTIAYPELAGLAQGRDMLLDGEVVAFREGVPTFAAIADRMHVRDVRKLERIARTNPVTLLVFDLLRLDAEDLTGLPLVERRTRLEALGLVDERWQVPAAYDDGQMLLQATDEQGLEGIVSKRRDSRYVFGARTPHWLKFPHRRRTSWVVGGWRLETDSTSRLGALLVGQPTPDGLRFMGRVGSGIAGKGGQSLLELLLPLARETSPFVDEVPRVDALGTRWVEPRLVVDVESLGLSGQGRLRQPSYRGVRTDLTPADLETQS
ncbi:non-homologous end-joining DNA ligase [Nocardioides gansuensis]|nr:non-homologous end-joining DNA ligase [Nocardioides gansuensis]